MTPLDYTRELDRARRMGTKSSAELLALARAGENVTHEAHIATPEEAAAILKLRNRAGWWEGDRNALQVLREFAAHVRAEAARDVAATLNFNPGADAAPAEVRATKAA